jgi:hypothetical protein
MSSTWHTTNIYIYRNWLCIDWNLQNFLKHSKNTAGMNRLKIMISVMKFSSFLYHLQVRGAQITGTGSPWRLNFLRWFLTFLGWRYGTCFKSTSWRIERCGGSHISEQNLCTPALRFCVSLTRQRMFRWSVDKADILEPRYERYGSTNSRLHK